MVFYRYKVVHLSTDATRHVIVVSIPEKDLSREHSIDDVKEWCKRKGLAVDKVFRRSNGYTKDELIAVRHGGKIKTI